MKPMTLNMSKFKKISHDEHSTTMMHDDGHVMKIAHAALPVLQRKQLEKMPIHNFAEGGDKGLDPIENEDFSYGKKMDAPPKAEQVPVQAQQAYSEPSAPPVVAPEQSNPEPINQQQLLSDGTPPQVAQPQDTMGNAAYAQNQLGALNEMKQGQQGIAKVQGQLGANEAKAEQEYQNDLKAQDEAYNKAKAPLESERLALQEDLSKNPVDADRYIKNMSTGGKISTALGLIFGGLGSGLTGGPNVAAQFLQKQIDADMDAQKADIGKKENLLSHNLQVTKNLNESLAMGRIQKRDIVSSKLKQLAATAQSDAARYNILKIAGALDAQSASIQHEYAKQKMALENPAGALELLPPEKRERAVKMPEGGIRFAITKDGAAKLREEIGTVQPIFNSLNKLDEIGSSALVPGSAGAQKAEAIRAQLIPLVNEASGLKRLSAEDIQNINKMFRDPSKFSQLVGGAGKTQQFKAFLMDKLNSTMSNQLEGDYTPSKQGEATILGKDGKKYIRQGNYMVPVGS